MNPVLSAVWIAVLVLGVALIVLGVVLRRGAHERGATRANAVVILGILLFVGGSAGLRGEVTN